MKFKLTIERHTEKDEPFSVHRYDVIEDKSLIEILSKLLILVVSIQKSIDVENQVKEMNDDYNIPF